MMVYLALAALDPSAKLLFGLALLILILLALFILTTVNYWAKRRYLPKEDHTGQKKTETPDPWAESAKRLNPDDDV